MLNAATAAILGTAAAICTTVAFVPQIHKIFKTGGRDVSYPMLVLYLAGVSLWLGYGLTIRAAAMIWANALSAALVATCIALKLIRDGESRQTNRSAPRKLRIAIDMDETIANSLKEHVRRFKVAFGVELTADDLRGKEIEDLAPAGQRAAVERMAQEGSFYEDLEVMEGAQEVVRELAGEHEVFIVSAAMDVPESFSAKYRWVKKHFPFIPPGNLVFCGDKEIIDADYLIDDQARHFVGFRGTGILFSAPHNAKEAGWRRAGSWEDIRRLFLAERRLAERARPERSRMSLRPAKID
jgi:5'-nucleotidase